MLTDAASELALSAILEQPDDAGVFRPDGPIAYESGKLTQPEGKYPPNLLELLAVVHTLKTPPLYHFDKPFKLHTDNASLKWLQQQCHVSHHRARWLNLIAEYNLKYNVVHIPNQPRGLPDEQELPGRPRISLVHGVERS